MFAAASAVMDPAAVGRADELRHAFQHFRDAEEVEQPAVIFTGFEVDQIVAGGVATLLEDLAGQEVPDEVLVGQHMPDPRVLFRLAVLQPAQQYRELHDHDVLVTDRVDFGDAALEFVGQVRGAAVGGEDAVHERLAVLAEHVQPLAVADRYDAVDLASIQSGGFQRGLDRLADVTPHLAGVDFAEAGTPLDGVGRERRDGQLPAILVDDDDLGVGSAIVNGEEMLRCVCHDDSLLNMCR